MRYLLLTAGAALAIAPLGAASGAVFTVGGPLSHNCYQSALSRSDSRFSLEGCDRALAEEALSPEDRAATLVNRGIVYMVRSNVRNAEADFDAALAIDPSLSDAYLNKGFLRIRNGQGREALAFVQKGIDLGAENRAIALFGRGVAYEQMGEYANAYRDFRKAQALEPDWSMPRDYLAAYKVGR